LVEARVRLNSIFFDHTKNKISFMNFNLNDLGKLIAQSAPLLGGALAGQAGATIGSLIAAKFGGNSSHPDALHALISADPLAAIKLKELECEHEIALQQLLMQAEKDAQQTLANDRASARQREAEVDKTPVEQRDKTPARLAYVLTAGILFGFIWLLVSDKNHELLYALTSSLVTVWVAAMAYYHGSSAGSRSKDRKLMQLFQQRDANDA
jgi:hypothetical protein